MSEWTVDSLQNFESEIADMFNKGLIRYPVHLSSNNENELIEIFSHISRDDWIFCTWRSHYQCLLKGVPKKVLKQAIVEGRSIALCFPEFKIFSSAIVAGHLAIATGVATSIKKRGAKEKVWCFLGDMTSETGMAQTCIRFAINHDLPITFIIEDNNISVLTDTRGVWNTSKLTYELSEFPNVISYKYKNNYPHAGAGERVQF